MKVLSIGRNPDCNIVCNDNMVSRRHALLKVYPNGKYEIVSQGPNGTTVNGNLIVPNQPYPLKRGDMVIFASHSKLDWKKVPDPLKPYKIGAIAFGAAAIIIAAILLVNFFTSDSDDVYEGGSSPVELVPGDSTSKDSTSTTDLRPEPTDAVKDAVAKSLDELKDKGTADDGGKTVAPAPVEIDPIQAELQHREKARAERRKAREEKQKAKAATTATTPPATNAPAKKKEPAKAEEPKKEESKPDTTKTPNIRL